MCQRCKNAAHEDDKCDAPIDIKGTMKYWGRSKTVAKRCASEVAWIIKTKGLEELHKAVLRAQLKPTDFPELDGYMTLLAEAKNISAAIPIPPAARPLGPVGRNVTVNSGNKPAPAHSSSQDGDEAAPASSSSKGKNALRTRTPRIKSAKEKEIEALFKLCYPHPPQDIEQPEATEISDDETLSSQSVTLHQEDVHKQALKVIEARREEKNGFPPSKKGDFHAIRMGFCASNKKSTVLTNHVIIDKIPSKLWKYSLGGEIPTSVSRKKKKVLIETMIKRMTFLDENRQHFTYDSNGTFYSCKDLYSLAEDQALGDLQTQPPIVTLSSVPGSRRMATQIPSARSGPQGLDTILNVHLEGADKPSVDMNAFTNTYKGNSLEIDNDVLEVVNALNSIVAKAAGKVTNDLHRTFQIGGNKFFLFSGHKPLGNAKTAVLQVNVGFYSTAKAGMGSGLLNINIATSAFYQPIGVDEYLYRIDSPDNWDISSKEVSGLKGIRVYIKCVRGRDSEDGTPAKDLPINQTERRFRTIHSLGLSCDKQEFDLDGMRRTVAEYQKLSKLRSSLETN